MAKPTLMFTAGAWHSPEFYTPLFSKLEASGYKCIGLSLLAVNTQPPVQDLQADIDAVHKAVLEEVEVGNDVVTIAHSWSGIVMSGALDGLSKVEREREGKKGGVVKVAYISAFVPFEGISLLAAFGGTAPDWWDVKEPWVTVKNPDKIFFNDLDAKNITQWTSKLRPHSYAATNAGAASCAWRRIPSTYLVCEDDNAITVAVQDTMVKACQDAGAPMKTERLFAGHDPFVSKPNETALFVRRVAGESV